MVLPVAEVTECADLVVFNTFGPLHIGDDLWIGFSDVTVEGMFEWVSGEPVTFTNWACCIGCGPEPNNCFGDDQGVIWRFGGGLGGEWADLTNCAAFVPNSTPYGVVEVAGPGLVLWNKLGSVQEIENRSVCHS